MESKLKHIKNTVSAQVINLKLNFPNKHKEVEKEEKLANKVLNQLETTTLICQ